MPCSSPRQIDAMVRKGVLVDTGPCYERMSHRNITQLSAGGLWLLTGLKSTHCKAIVIPVWVETAGALVCGRVTHRSPGWWSPPAVPKTRPPRDPGRIDTRVGETKMVVRRFPVSTPAAISAFGLPGVHMGYSNSPGT